jgi:hypothetical protein
VKRVASWRDSPSPGSRTNLKSGSQAQADAGRHRCFSAGETLAPPKSHSGPLRCCPDLSVAHVPEAGFGPTPLMPTIRLEPLTAMPSARGYRTPLRQPELQITGPMPLRYGVKSSASLWPTAKTWPCDPTSAPRDSSRSNGIQAAGRPDTLSGRWDCCTRYHCDGEQSH